MIAAAAATAAATDRRKITINSGSKSDLGDESVDISVIVSGAGPGSSLNSS